MNTQIIKIKGAAVHTRDIQRDKDYGWYVIKGDMSLYDQTEDIYRTLLRDVSGDTRKFALITSDGHAGLLFCDIPSERIDHGNRIIYDTLYLEFSGIEEVKLIAEFTASLLTYPNTEYKKHEERVVKYAEQLYQDKDNQNINDISFAFEHCQNTGESIRFSGKTVLPYNNGDFTSNPNVRKCAKWLKYLAGQSSESFKNGSIFVSTGRVGLERCRHIAKDYATCLILTMSSEVRKEERIKEIPFLNNLKKINFSKVKADNKFIRLLYQFYLNRIRSPKKKSDLMAKQIICSTSHGMPPKCVN